MKGAEMEYNDHFSPMRHIAPHRAAILSHLPANKSHLPTELLRLQNKTQKDDPVSKLQHLMDQSIVSAAIEQVIETSKAPQTSNKRSLEGPLDKGADQVTQGKPAKVAKKNAFAAMMVNASSNRGKSANAPVRFDQSAKEYEQIVSSAGLESEQYIMGKVEVALQISIATEKWLTSWILPHLKIAPHLQTMINALHVMIDIATGIAYAAASKSTISKHICSLSDSRLPIFLVSNMYKIVMKMSASEMKQLVEEEGFIFKLKTLRQNPLLPLESESWNSLDEILRLVKHPGPVDFRQFYSDVNRSIVSAPHGRPSSDLAIKIIQAEILPYVTRSTCFETKYNALNTLADIGLLLQSRGCCYNDNRLILDVLFGAISTISTWMDEEEVDKVVSELRSDTETSHPGWLDNFNICMETRETYEDLGVKFGDLQRPQYHLGQTSVPPRVRLQLLCELVTRKVSKPAPLYGQKRLLIKILFLRWSDPTKWGASLSKLNTAVRTFPNRTVPLQTDLILEEMDDRLEICSQFKVDFHQTSNAMKHVSACIERNISRVSQHATRGTIVGIKFSALHLLVEIGLRIAEWCHISRPGWQRYIFLDHILEDSLTDSMLFILSSLSKQDWEQAVQDQKFLDDLTELDIRRSLIPECLEGLDAVVRITRDPGHSVTKASRPKKVIIDLEKEEDVIDLTGEDEVIDLTGV